MSVRSVCVYCGSTGETIPAHRAATQELGEILGESGINLVFGGGHIGLMGVLADAVLENGGEVTGVIPRFLVDWEVAHEGLTRQVVVESMHERKQAMFELSDAFLILPGGLGTLDEMFEILTWKQLKLHDKPLFLVDVEGYWEPLRSLFGHLVKTGYAPGDTGDLFRVMGSMEELKEALKDLPASAAPDTARRM